jgi:sec-independent protein translocase protein TatC
MAEEIRDGPIGDEEQSLREHLIELRKRFTIVIIPLILITLITFPFSNQALTYIFEDLVPEGVPLFVYSPIEWIALRFLFSLVCALAITIPLLLYETFAFISPGLYPHEKRFILKILLPSLSLYILGIILAYYLVLPLIFSVLIPYGGDLVEPALSAKRIFSLIFYTSIWFGLIFQVPLVVTLAVKTGVTNYQALRAKRGIIYLVAILIALFINFDPTGISQVVVAALLIILFEFGLLITRLIWG